MKASDLFIKILEQNGVECIYWLPWEENLDLLESIRTSKIKLIVTRNEQTAVFMAATYGRLTWKPWVALATLWPWATNMVTWVAYAQLWWFPIILITWQKPIRKSKQWFFQIIDVVSMMKPITKYSISIVSALKIPYIVNNAFRIATLERPWAVHIELPEDIAREQVEESFTNVEKIRRPIIDEKSILRLKEELEKSKSPIILVWAGANRKRITKYLTKFITTYNIPFFNSQMWKWVVDESLPQYLWTRALTNWDYIHEAIKKSDLILSVWYDQIEKPTHLFWVWWSRVIHINFYGSNTDEVYSPFLEIVGDIWNTFWQLTQKKINNKWDFSEIYKIRDNYTKIIKNNLKNEIESSNITMFPRQLVSEVREVLKKDDILVLDNWLYKLWFARNYICFKPNTLLLDNALATMWAWVSSALEAKRLNPDKNVVCVTGDGGFLMNLWDLETVVRLTIDLTIIVLNNNSYWMIKWKQKNIWFGDFGLDYLNPDFVKLAESFWWIWYKVQNKKDFKKVFKKANKQKWLKIIDLNFDYPMIIE